MEKFSRWTDASTQINPFIHSKQSIPLFSIKNILSLILILVKVFIIFGFHPIFLGFLALMFLQEKIDKPKIPFVGKLVKLLWRVNNLILFGMWGTDDESFQRVFNKEKQRLNQKNNKSGILILSNNTSILDVFYYLSKVENVRFIVSSFEQKQLYAISGITLLKRILTNPQPFCSYFPKGVSFETLINTEMKQKGNNCVLFYEGIRTNGMGTIKISTQMSKNIFQNRIDYCISHIKYFSNYRIHSVVNAPIKIILSAMGEFKIGIKVRARSQQISKIYSVTELQKQIDIFLMANASKLLETQPKDYFDFMEQYKKVMP